MTRCLPRCIHHRPLTTIASLCGLCFLLHCLDFPDISARRYDTWQTCSYLEPTCSTFAVAADTVVVVKTGGSEPLDRLDAQLETLLSRVPRENVLIFSDMEEQIGSYQVHDMFDDISEEERAEYPEFALYDAQWNYQRQGHNVRLMGLEGGWELAKYMNLAMIRRILKTQHDQNIPPKKWYVFIDTDTFISWENLFTLLEHLNPSDRNYIGSPVWLPKLQFAHGGSAYVLSYAAMSALDSSPSLERPSQFGFNTTALCCGDEALARALKSKGVVLRGYWPMFNGERPETLSFGKECWCEPVVSLHHLDGEDMRSLWRWMEDWTSSGQPLLYKDLFEYIAPEITSNPERSDWDNTDEDMKIYPRERADAHKSFEHCRICCEADKACVQFVFDGSACALSHHIRLGQKRAPEQNRLRRFKSGWNLVRIEEWTMKRQCKSAHWVRSNP